MTHHLLHHACYDLFSLPSLLQAILTGFLSDFSQAVKDCASEIVNAAVEIYDRLSVDLLPTPAKSHYVFNLRDLSKCVQGETQGPHTDVHKFRPVSLNTLQVIASIKMHFK